MFKKIVSMVMICAILIPLSSAVAADNTSVQPTIEEILNGYHEKAFEAQIAPDAATASTYSRQADRSSKTLEQETVDELTAAGYEAYNVTNENYNELEDSLKTDFSELGLDLDGSYIVIISGEDPATPANSTRGSDLLLPPHVDNGDNSGGDTFTYTKDGDTYTMRYVIISSMDQECLYVKKDFALSDAAEIIELIGGLVDIALAGLVDKAISFVTVIPVTSIVSMGSLFANWLTDDGLEELDPNTVTMHSSTRWTRSYIQVRNPENGNWHTSQCSSYANSIFYCDAGLVFNPLTGKDEPCIGECQDIYTYSPFYHDSSTRMDRAVRGYLGGGPLYDCTGDINFYFVSEEGNVVVGTEGKPLFTHEEDDSYLLALIQED